MNRNGVPRYSALMTGVAIVLTIFVAGCSTNATDTQPSDAVSTTDKTNQKSDDVNKKTAQGKTLRIVVMDPLAEPLSCTCVKGHGQRHYDKLAEYLSQQLSRPVDVLFDESLGLAYGRKGRNVDLIIGKRSMVLFDAKLTKTDVRTISHLTGKQGRTTVTGLILVRKDDPAKSLADLKGRKLMLGPEEDAETNAAVNALLKTEQLSGKVTTETAGSIDAAVFALTDEEADAAVVSDFLPPLLEGCGKVEKGSLRVIGQTEPVPFVEVFATAIVSDEEEQAIRAALQEIKDHPQVLLAMETKLGFVSAPTKTPVASSEKPTVEEWTDWRGPRRDGLSRFVPTSLPETLEAVWSAEVTGPALAGIAATQKYVIVADKDRKQTRDIFRCFSVESGKQL